ncbi:AAA family ATPase [Streptomyces coeruleorubidus]|uniref:AAA family ATPase n=1 Tax=Streptomyces coeruleorubidus TaxID=116188 RepID=UPI0033BB5889
MVYLLAGLTGSGKTTYAMQRLESAGAVRLSVDELVHARHGRYDVDYPERDCFAREASVVAEVLALACRAGMAAILDTQSLCLHGGFFRMRSTRIAISAAMLGALALPALSATTASAATVPTAATTVPAVSCHNLPPVP